MSKVRRRRLALLSGIVVLALIGVGLFVFLGGDASAKQFATLTVLEGQVEVAEDGGDFGPARDGQPLSQGDVVRTGDDGRAEIEYFEGSLTRLDFDTEFELEELATLDGTSTRIVGNKTKGQTWNRVTKLADADSRFEIKTPNATAAVRGTLFLTRCDPTGCTFVSLEEAIEVCVDEECVTLNPFDVVFVSADGEIGPVTQTTEAELAELEWVVYNQCELGDRAFLVVFVLCPPEEPPTPEPTPLPEPSPTPTETPDEGDGVTPPEGETPGDEGTPDGDGDGGGGGPGPVTPPGDDDAPAPPVILEPDPGDTVTGNPVTIQGLAESGSTVGVLEGSELLGVTPVNSPWQIDLRFAPGTHTIRATATDAAGNRSKPSDPVTFVLELMQPPPPPPPSADLAVEKSGPSSIFDDEIANYVVTVTNRGPDVAADVVLTDRVEGGRTESFAGPGDCTLSDSERRVVCRLGDLEPGESVGLGVDVAPGPLAGSIVNTASVDSDTDDPRTGNSSATAVTSITRRAANLSLVKTGPASADEGDSVVHTLTVSNAGPDDAIGVTTTDTVTGGTVSSVSDPAGTSCTFAGSQVDCFTAVLPSGTQAVIQVTVMPNEGVAVVRDSAVTSSETLDPNEANNDDTFTTAIIPDVANLSIQKTGPSTIDADGVAVYTITVTNNGPAAAENLVVEDVVSGGFIVGMSSASAGVDCPDFETTGGGPSSETCTLASLGVGQSIHIQVEVQHDGSSSSIVDSATASADNAEPKSDGATTNVDFPAPDLSINKSGPNAIESGDEATYTITVSNDGDAAATNVVVTDTVQFGGFIDSMFSESPGVDCPGGGDEVTAAFDQAACTMESLDPGETIEIEVEVDHDGESPAILNTANASADNAQSVFDGKVTQVNEPAGADLEVTKTGDTLIGEFDDAEYTVTVTNNGPETATNVLLDEELTNATFDEVSAGKGSPCGFFTPGNMSIITDCPLGDIAPGDSVSLFVEAAPDGPGTMTNTASVTSDTADPVPGNNIDTAVTDVEEEIDVDLTGAAARDGIREDKEDGRRSRMGIAGIRAVGTRFGVRVTWQQTSGSAAIVRYATADFPTSVDAGRAGCSGVGGCTITGLLRGTTVYLTVFAPGERSVTPVRRVNAASLKVRVEATSPGAGDRRTSGAGGTRSGTGDDAPIRSRTDRDRLRSDAPRERTRDTSDGGGTSRWSVKRER